MGNAEYMGSRAMAVKLILVVLVLAVVSSSLAQQTAQSGGQTSDRRLALRRFRSRNRDSQRSDEVKENRGQNPRKLANQEEIIKRRKELLQRNNITRRKNINRKPAVNEVKDETTKRTVRIKSPSAEDDVVVEKISNNDRDIISKVLNQAEKEDSAPFRGKSEVRTLSAPSGFRSSNEQITRISFKRTTTSKPEEKEVGTERRIPGRNPVRSRLTSGRRVISRGRQTDRVETTTARVLLLSQASPALKALLATANDAEESEPTEETVKSEENLPADAKAAIREMHEDNREEDVPVNPRGRQRGDRRRVRVNLRGRPAGAEEDKPRSSSSNNRFRSFPAREGGEGRARGIVVTARPRQVVTTTSLPPIIPATTETLRFQTRPTPASSTESVADFFQGFDFPAPIPVVRPQAAQAAPATPSLQEVTEVPLSVFSLQQTLGAAAGPQAAPVVPQPQQPRAFPAQQFSPQPSQPSSEIKPFVHHLPSPPVAAPTQAPAPLSVNRFQPAATPQSLPASQPQFNSFNLLNTNNFAAFDAQFGGAAPLNNGNGVTQLSSNIFAQPGSRLLQGNDVIVNAPSVFGGFGQTSNFQSGAFGTG